MAPPIRTNLDHRMALLTEALDEFFGSITKEYAFAIQAIGEPEDVPVAKIVKLRERAQRQAENLSQELLLVLTLNQPLLQDLRVIAAYLRGIDVIERLARHARDVSLTMSDWASQQSTTDDEVVRTGLEEMGRTVSQLIDVLREHLIKQTEIQPEVITELWGSIQSQYETMSKIILEAEKDVTGGREGRLLLSKVASRFERSGYNLVRLAGLWHYALENEWIHYEH
jgi:phosphate uptake regulator